MQSKAGHTLSAGFLTRLRRQRPQFSSSSLRIGMLHVDQTIPVRKVGKMRLIEMSDRLRPNGGLCAER
jgi:hypothetical protein